MATSVYVLCAITSLLCALLLLRAWSRGRTRLLLWTSLCFVFLALNNVILVVDLVFLPVTIDLSVVRSATAAIGGAVLVLGLIWEAQ